MALAIEHLCVAKCYQCQTWAMHKDRKWESFLIWCPAIKWVGRSCQQGAEELCCTKPLLVDSEMFLVWRTNHLNLGLFNFGKRGRHLLLHILWSFGFWLHLVDVNRFILGLLEQFTSNLSPKVIHLYFFSTPTPSLYCIYFSLNLFSLHFLSILFFSACLYLLPTLCFREGQGECAVMVGSQILGIRDIRGGEVCSTFLSNGNGDGFHNKSWRSALSPEALPVSILIAACLHWLQWLWQHNQTAHVSAIYWEQCRRFKGTKIQ